MNRNMDLKVRGSEFGLRLNAILKINTDYDTVGDSLNNFEDSTSISPTTTLFLASSLVRDGVKIFYLRI